MKFKAPCWVTIDGSAEPLRLVRVVRPSGELRKQGWRGLVAQVQNNRGIGLTEYRKLRACPAIH